MQMQICKIVLVLIIIYIQAGKAQLISKLSSVKCSCHPDYLRNLSCALKAYGRYNVSSEVVFDIVKEIPEVSMHFQLFKFYNQFRPFFIDHVFDVCRLTSGTFSAFYSHLVMASIRDSNLIQKCPYDVKHYYANNVYFDAKLIDRLSDMVGEYRADLTFRNAAKIQFGKISYRFTLRKMPNFVPKQLIPGNA